MPGGLMQLVALGVQDMRLTHEESFYRAFPEQVCEKKFIEVHVRHGECPICLEDFEDSHNRDIPKEKTDEALGIVANCCGIIIHKSCADQVVEVQNSDKCPHCRQCMKKEV